MLIMLSVHCSAEQQRVLAKDLEDVLAKQLAPPFPTGQPGGAASIHPLSLARVGCPFSIALPLVHPARMCDLCVSGPDPQLPSPAALRRRFVLGARMAYDPAATVRDLGVPDLMTDDDSDDEFNDQADGATPPPGGPPSPKVRKTLIFTAFTC